MAVCTVCNKDQFLIYRQYHEHKLEIPRCLGCLVKFPENGFELAVNGKDEKNYVRIKRKYHAWALVQQTQDWDVWNCSYCTVVITSPKLGIPTSIGCMVGSKYVLRSGFWASLRLANIMCPLCDGLATLLQKPKIIRKRPKRQVFPFTCESCYDNCATMGE